MWCVSNRSIIFFEYMNRDLLIAKLYVLNLQVMKEANDTKAISLIFDYVNEKKKWVKTYINFCLYDFQQVSILRDVFVLSISLLLSYSFLLADEVDILSDLNGVAP